METRLVCRFVGCVINQTFENATAIRAQHSMLTRLRGQGWHRGGLRGHPIDNLVGVRASDNVEVEVNPNFYCCICVSSADGRRRGNGRSVSERGRIQRSDRDGEQHWADFAIGVLALLLIASLYSWTVILGKWSTFGKATRESKRFIRALS